MIFISVSPKRKTAPGLRYFSVTNSPFDGQIVARTVVAHQNLIAGDMKCKMLMIDFSVSGDDQVIFRSASHCDLGFFETVAPALGGP